MLSVDKIYWELVRPEKTTFIPLKKIMDKIAINNAPSIAWRL